MFESKNPSLRKETSNQQNGSSGEAGDIEEIEGEHVTDPKELRDIFLSKQEADRNRAWQKTREKYDIKTETTESVEPVKSQPGLGDKYLYGFSSASEGIDQLTRDIESSIDSLNKTLSEARAEARESDSSIKDAEIIEENPKQIDG